MFSSCPSSSDCGIVKIVTVHHNLETHSKQFFRCASFSFEAPECLLMSPVTMTTNENSSSNKIVIFTYLCHIAIKKYINFLLSSCVR